MLVLLVVRVVDVGVVVAAVVVWFGLVVTVDGGLIRCRLFLFLLLSLYCFLMFPFQVFDSLSFFVVASMGVSLLLL